MSTSGGFYLASKVKHAARWKRLRDAGIPVRSTWIDEAGEGETADYAELASRCVAEIASASALILYCEPGEVLKGALLEAGVAIGLKVPVYCVGECESLSRVFIQHPLWHTADSVESAIAEASPGNVRAGKRISHTPGPWYDAGPLGAGIDVVSEKRPIAVVYGPNNEAGPKADAKLVAAAPEMYEALKAYESLEKQMAKCEGSCEDGQQPELCGDCFPFADDARCKIRAIIAQVEAR